MDMDANGIKLPNGDGIHEELGMGE